MQITPCSRSPKEPETTVPITKKAKEPLPKELNWDHGAHDQVTQGAIDQGAHDQVTQGALDQGAHDQGGQGAYNK